ncbi:unnamed protein product [Dibothriocephalus latus]|uniref:Ras-GEF domain-containing protein n=1 Tax=Dibothriocephalus latus TaxID=60516 RepID=A0A3P6SL10_DIBLA|nr:unnamed protein product [Dibothriocephalus latus]
MQRYIAFAPIEPGGLGCLVDGEQHSAEGAWMEALNTARFLVKVLSEAASDEFSSQFMLKIVHYARVLQMDSKSAQKRASSDGPINANWINGLKENDAPDVEIPVMRDQTASSEQDTEDTCIEPLPKQLKDLANKLLLLIPYSAGGLKVTGETGVNKCRVRVPAEKTATSSVPAGPINYCSCQERLHKFLHFDTQEIAEQITLNEEAHFQKIDLKEFIAIKRLMQGNTPTLSNCVKHFNDVSAWVKVLLRMANEYGCPWRQSFSSSNSSTIPLPEASIDQNNFSIKTRDHQSPQNNAVICQVCGLPQQLRPRKPPGGSPTNGFYFRLQSRPCESGFEIKSASSSDSYSKTRNYLCMTVGSQNLSLRGKKQNLLLENVLWNLCCVAEKLTEFGAYMVPPAFTTYRHDLESAKMPCLPYLGLIFQQLIHLDSGNALFLPSQTQPDENDTAPGETTSALITDDEKDSQKIVNYWRCWKHYLILGYFMKRLQLSEENCQIMSSTLQWNDVVDNGSLLYKSYTAGCESPHYQNVSPQPPVAGTPTKGLSSSQTPESLHSLVRFRTQAKDQFVVRVVKITDKSSSLNPSNKQESLSASPRLDVFDQESVQLRLNQSGDGVFVGFQAQMPAMSKAWEKSSGRSGILLEVLTALRLTVENMLKQIRLDGLRTILPEEDYVFYPLRSDELQ